MSALLSAMASSRSSCSCRRSRASRSCSAFSLSRLAHASCCSSLPNCKGKTQVGLRGPGAAATGWGGGGGGDEKACSRWAGHREPRCWHVRGRGGENQKKPKACVLFRVGKGHARPSPDPQSGRGHMHGEARLSLTLTSTLDLRETSHLSPLQGTEAGNVTHQYGDIKRAQCPSPPQE